MTNTIRQHILSYFDDLDYDNIYNSKDKLRLEINELNKQYKYTSESARKMVEAGFFLIYYDDVREFFKSIAGNNTVDTMSNDELWEQYKNLLAFTIKDILNYKM